MKWSDFADKDVRRFWKKVRAKPAPACWEWLGSTTISGIVGKDRHKETRHATFWFQGKHHPAQRVMYALYHGDCTGRTVMHTCNNSLCVKPGHLTLGTSGDSQRNTYRRGLRGTRLSEETVRAIKAHAPWKRGDGSRLARELGVSETMVRLIRAGKRYEWVKP